MRYSTKTLSLGAVAAVVGTVAIVVIARGSLLDGFFGGFLMAVTIGGALVPGLLLKAFEGRFLRRDDAKPVRRIRRYRP